MTIAACYLSSEGVVLGADSRTSIPNRGHSPDESRISRYDYAQKVFEFGEHSTVGITMWGLGGLGGLSYRTLIAETADQVAVDKVPTFEGIAKKWASVFWEAYCAAFQSEVGRARELVAKAGQLSEEEQEELAYYKVALSGGFCLGGRWGSSRRPHAFEILFDPSASSMPEPEALEIGEPRFWGWPGLVERLHYGMDWRAFSAILQSDKWQGTRQDLFDVVWESSLIRPRDLPLREAVDFIHSSIYTTIKAMKFSHLEPACGGPIEIAAITTDRPFRWICHKRLSEAISFDRTPEVWTWHPKSLTKRP